MERKACLNSCRGAGHRGIEVLYSKLKSLDEAGTLRKTLKKSQNLCTSACQQAVEIYDHLAQNRSIEDICFRSETCPSVADMLEWITCTEQHFSSHVHARELLLEEANFGDDFKAGAFVKEWKDDSALIESMNDVLATTKFVMDMV
ncbi:AFG2-interacting ribosome maturation factor-like isoform X2 [Dermacentor albipictus]|uniref:AFG2-interacting ribosome maturation factor-like isoform X2 n=1 Tax=Dermacentor albipictus TaxID=60249 RepID=UPI0031FD44F1